AGEQRDTLAVLASRYLATLRRSGTTGAETRFITDRGADLPWLIGFAATLFPQAPIIHVLRHPVDIVLSGFAQDRLYAGNAGVTLASLARLYDAQMQAIAHIRGQMTLRYFPVRYEDMVLDPAATLGTVLDFIAIQADPVALLTAPPRTVPRAPTHRVLQQAPYRRSLYRHRAFGAVFDDAMPILTPWIERLGYDRAERIAA
ncbi:MAG TPA: sulfotransferase, partial [Acidiphilium sp.]